VREDLKKAREETQQLKFRITEMQIKIEAAEKERDLALKRNEELLDLYINAASAAEKPQAKPANPAEALKDLTLGASRSCFRCGSGGLVYEFEGKVYCHSCLGKVHPLLS
jgi:hypothetical protein